MGCARLTKPPSHSLRTQMDGFVAHGDGADNDGTDYYAGNKVHSKCYPQNVTHAMPSKIICRSLGCPLKCRMTSTIASPNSICWKECCWTCNLGCHSVNGCVWGDGRLASGEQVVDVWPPTELWYINLLELRIVFTKMVARWHAIFVE